LGLTLLLAGWPAVGMLAEIDFLLEAATPILYVYQFVLWAVLRGFPGFGLFWVGFVVFCFGTATVLVSLVDRIRI
jgi:hypothetical protein